MSKLVSRILLAVLMLPLATVVYLVAAIAAEMDRGLNQRERFLIGGAAAGVFVLVYWTLLWFRTVRWHATRLILTGALTIGSLFVGLISGLVGALLDRGFGAFLGPVVAILIWLVMTVLVWRETSRERAARLQGRGDAIACPVCGYNMTGLSTSTCPECGAAFTLEELIASQATADDLG